MTVMNKDNNSYILEDIYSNKIDKKVMKKLWIAIKQSLNIYV